MKVISTPINDCFIIEPKVFFDDRGYFFENFNQVYIPRGCAHGFLVKSETAVFAYKCDNVYNKESEGGIIYNDPSLDIDWEYNLDEVIVSDKDKILPLFKNALPI